MRKNIFKFLKQFHNFISPIFSLLLIILIGIVILSFISHLFYSDNYEFKNNKIIISGVDSQDDLGVEEKINNFQNINNKQNFLELSLPIKYFSEKNIRHGSVNNKNGWDSASFEEMTYQSYPTTNITLSDDAYSNENRPLGNPKSLEQIMKENKTCGKNKNLDCGFTEQIKNNYNENKDIASYYLPIDSVYKESFDVDNDGKDEIIVFACEIGGNHCPHYIEIIKDNKIIFHAEGISIDIKSVDSKNGFYLEWKNASNYNEGFCCPTGYVRTRFVYKDNKFIPILEQFVNYLKIKNVDN